MSFALTSVQLTGRERHRRRAARTEHDVRRQLGRRVYRAAADEADHAEGVPKGSKARGVKMQGEVRRCREIARLHLPEMPPDETIMRPRWTRARSASAAEQTPELSMSVVVVHTCSGKNVEV